MKNLIGICLIVGLAVGFSPTVVLAEEGADAKAASKEGAAKEGEQAQPENKVDMSEEVIFERLTGLYFEGRGGVFFTVGGSRGFSNGQPFFGFEVGYDITDALSMQLAYYSGYQAVNPIEDPDVCQAAGKLNCDEYHLDFGLTFVNLSADYDVWSGRRFALEVRAGGGVVIIDPSATPDQGPVDGDVFGGLRFEYYTLLRHFTLGAEFDFFYVIPTGIPAMAISLSVLYNF